MITGGRHVTFYLSGFVVVPPFVISVAESRGVPTSTRGRVSALSGAYFTHPPSMEAAPPQTVALSAQSLLRTLPLSP